MSDRDIPNQDLSIDLCHKLGLDPNQTTKITADWEADSMDHVTIRWEGFARITRAQFEELLNRR